MCMSPASRRRDAANLAGAIACLQIVSPTSPDKIRGVKGKGHNIIRILRRREFRGCQRWLHKAATLDAPRNRAGEFPVAQASRNGGKRGELLALDHRRNQQEKDEIQHTDENKSQDRAQCGRAGPFQGPLRRA